jgi:hypothetical protein
MGIHSTREYSYWKAYDPTTNFVTTLEKASSDVQLEDSSAFKQLLRMYRVRLGKTGYLERRAKSSNTTLPNGSKKTFIKRKQRPKRGNPH